MHTVAQEIKDGDGKVTVKSLTLSDGPLTLTAGSSATLTATVTTEPEGKEVAIEWTSSDTTVAKVENGKITALKAGEATITVTVGGVSATCTITVNAAAPSSGGSSGSSNATLTFATNGGTAVAQGHPGERFDNRLVRLHDHPQRLYLRRLVLRQGVDRQDHFGQAGLCNHRLC